MREHLHKCKSCELYFGCRCEDIGSIFGDCPDCIESSMPVARVLLILAGLTVWLLVIRILL